MNNRNSLLDLTQLFLIFIFFLLPIIYNSRGSWKTTWNNHFYFIYLTNNNSRLRLSYIVGRKKNIGKSKQNSKHFCIHTSELIFLWILRYSSDLMWKCHLSFFLESSFYPIANTFPSLYISVHFISWL